jgi:heme A synthase
MAADLDPNAHFLVRLRVYHPVIAVIVAVYSLYLVRILFEQNNGLARKFLAALVIAGILQLFLGLINLLLLVPVPTQLLHLLTADLVWVIYILTTATVLAKTHPASQTL